MVLIFYISCFKKILKRLELNLKKRDATLSQWIDFYWAFPDIQDFKLTKTLFHIDQKSGDDRWSSEFSAATSSSTSSVVNL